MKSRLTSWLAALLLITAVFGLPVTRPAATNRVACYQVYCEEREEDRAEQAGVPPAPTYPVFQTAAFPKTFSSRVLDHSLFQRPPPAFSL